MKKSRFGGSISLRQGRDVFMLVFDRVRKSLPNDFLF